MAPKSSLPATLRMRSSMIYLVPISRWTKCQKNTPEY